MKIKNKKGIEFELTREEWDNVIAGKGYAHMYTIVEDETPIEVKSLKIEQKKQTNKKS